MQPKWIGPYEVVSSSGKGVYSLRNQSTGKILQQAVHSVRLKEYFTQEATQTLETQTGEQELFLSLNSRLSITNFWLHSCCSATRVGGLASIVVVIITSLYMHEPVCQLVVIPTT